MEEDYLVIQERMNVEFAKQQPHILLQSSLKITVDGNQWCVLFGENLQDGVAGFGDTPQEAAWNFDHNWVNDNIKEKNKRAK